MPGGKELVDEEGPGNKDKEECITKLRLRIHLYQPQVQALSLVYKGMGGMHSPPLPRSRGVGIKEMRVCLNSTVNIRLL